MTEEVRDTVNQAITTYQSIGKMVPFNRVEVNPKSATDSDLTLNLWVIRTASKDMIDRRGCPTKSPTNNDVPIDDLSVRGGCYVTATKKPEIRCSAEAITLFGQHPPGQHLNPSLLYVMAHEIAHILQKRSGEYAGRSIVVTASHNYESRLHILQQNCDPVTTKREEEADKLAFQVLATALPSSPYREPTLSDRGSLLWNIDRLALSADAWQRGSAIREFTSSPKVHNAFEPTEFPTPPEKTKANAERFVQDVLESNGRVVSFPARSSTHPPIEVRLMNIVDALKPIAKDLPVTGGAKGYEPIAKLQQDLGDITSHIYRETGAYIEALHENVCSIVNAKRVDK
jgi:hypothetical protein